MLNQKLFTSSYIYYGSLCYILRFVFVFVFFNRTIVMIPSVPTLCSFDRPSPFFYCRRFRYEKSTRRYLLLRRTNTKPLLCAHFFYYFLLTTSFLLYISRLLRTVTLWAYLHLNCSGRISDLTCRTSLMNAYRGTKISNLYDPSATKLNSEGSVAAIIKG